MSGFTFLFRGRKLPDSAEERQAYLERWKAWFKALDEKGHLKDYGHPLEDAGRVVKGEQKTVNEDPTQMLKMWSADIAWSRLEISIRRPSSRKAARFWKSEGLLR